MHKQLTKQNINATPNYIPIFQGGQGEERSGGGSTEPALPQSAEEDEERGEEWEWRGWRGWEVTVGREDVRTRAGPELGGSGNEGAGAHVSYGMRRGIQRRGGGAESDVHVSGRSGPSGLPRTIECVAVAGRVAFSPGRMKIEG